MRGFSHQHPRWTVTKWELPPSRRTSPTCARVVTFQNQSSTGYVEVLDTGYGTTLAWTSVDDPHVARPLDIIFDAEDRLHFYHGTRQEHYVIDTTTDSVTPCAKQGLDGQMLEKHYRLDNGREWVICGSKRICWIPPGYIGSSHWWAGSSLVMAGQDGTLRKLTFPDSPV